MVRVASLVLLVGAFASPAAAAPDVLLAEGTILVGNPFGAIGGGISEIANDCSDDRGMDGIDGITFAVPEIAQGREAILTTSATGIDADVYWYDANCRPVGEPLAERGTGNETGTVPASATSGVIDLIVGAQAEVRLVAVASAGTG